MHGNGRTTALAPGKAAVSGSKTRLHALLVEDNSADAELVLHELRRGGFDLTCAVVFAPEQFRAQLRTNPPDVVLADYNLGQWSGMEALEILKNAAMDIPLILVSGALGDVTAVECIKQGVTDYVLKDSLARLPVSIRRALKEKQLRTERKQAEQELAHKMEELARSNRDLEQFAYVASHDLQEPLRMVAAYTQLLSERYRGKLDEQANKYITYAVEGATRMQTLIQDLLAFSRAGTQGMEVQATDCGPVVQQALKNLDAAIRESHAIVNYQDLPQVLADSRQLEHVFQNLIGNAIKFRGEEPPVVEISAEQHGDSWLFSVSDNGIGIAPEHTDDIFVIFQRLHTREDYAGNGIGLAICKKIIERHSGKIWVESHDGKGSTFRFTLPITALEPARYGIESEERAMPAAAGR